METFPRYWPFLGGTHRSLVDSPHKGLWRGALMFSLICAWGWWFEMPSCPLWCHCNAKKMFVCLFVLSMTSSDPPRSRHLFSFGVIADVQYADSEKRLNFEQVNWRCYREALGHLTDAVQVWNNSPGGHKVEFVLQLGDLIDGINKCQGQHQVSSLIIVCREWLLTNYQGYTY